MAGTYLTEGLSGTGGRVRAELEDFRVEEIPRTPPSGAGDYLHLWVEKRGVSTIEALRLLCRALGVAEGEAGYAGLKDARAVTRQWFSFRTREAPGEAMRVAQEAGLRVLEAARSKARIARGELAGNRFDILVRDAAPDAAPRARKILEVLAARGLPNAFGDQRFGAHGHTAQIGLGLAQGDFRAALAALLGGARFRFAGDAADGRLLEAASRYEAGEYARARTLWPPSWVAERGALARLARGGSCAQAAAALPARERALYGGALQAAVFNACLARRLEAGAHDRLWAGDVLHHHATGKARRVGAPETEEAALARFEVSPAGPLVGKRLLEARGEAGEIEREALESLGAGDAGVLEGLERLGLYGARRPYRVKIKQVRLRAERGGLRLEFVLPPGAYASEVLREVVKNEPPVGAVARVAEAGGSPRLVGGDGA